jgi:hypothetical protein
MVWYHIRPTIVFGSKLLYYSRVLSTVNKVTAISRTKIMAYALLYTSAVVVCIHFRKCNVRIVNSSNFTSLYTRLYQSQWPLARTLRSWIPIPLKARMSVCVYSVFVLFCV